MTIDLSAITYEVVAVMSDGTKINLDSVAENIAWEENERELAVRLNLTLRDVESGGKRLSDMLALCTVVYLFATWDGKQREIFRGTIWTWEHSQINDDNIILTCYDLLYYLQKSQDNRYFAKNTATKTVITKICDAWGVKIGRYEAPSVKHAKLLYKNKAVSAMLTETLKDADEKDGGAKSIIRAREGVVDMIRQGSNSDVFGLSASQNIVSSSDKYSMVDLVTRVIVTGKEDKNGKPKTEATINGQTQFGILQSIQSRGSMSLSDAKKAAQKVIDEKGKPTRTIILRCAEFPGIRKGDKVHVETDKMVGYFYVKGISHNVTTMVMQMEVEPV